MSYHDRIQERAREIEQARGKHYYQPGQKNELLGFTPKEQAFLYGAIYKLLRVAHNTKSEEKALDDIMDAYNFCALFYEEFTGRSKCLPDQRGLGSGGGAGSSELKARERFDTEWKKEVLKLSGLLDRPEPTTSLHGEQKAESPE